MPTLVETGLAAGRLHGCAFEIVNGLLAQSGARERAYTMPEWDVWFLTEEQFDALRAAIPAPRERPYAPIDDPPWYGEEH